MKRLAVLGLLGALMLPVGAIAVPSPSQAQTTLPQPNRNGDYGRSGHLRWVVVDPDPNGVNCRWSSRMPREWYSPGANLPPLTVVNWSVVRRFARGTILTANTTPAGFEMLYDTRNLPWLKVSIGANDQICLVRANRQFVRPVGE